MAVQFGKIEAQMKRIAGGLLLQHVGQTRRPGGRLAKGAGTGLKLVLPDWSLPSADIYAVFATRNHLSAKTRALVDFLLAAFEAHRVDEDGAW